jgi:hypothetical protein
MKGCRDVELTRAWLLLALLVVIGVGYWDEISRQVEWPASFSTAAYQVANGMRKDGMRKGFVRTSVVSDSDGRLTSSPLLVWNGRYVGKVGWNDDGRSRCHGDVES